MPLNDSTRLGCRWTIAGLSELGNGGAGPYHHALGTFDGAGGDEDPWTEFVGSLVEPFAFREPWNDLTGCPDDMLARSDGEEYERRIDAFERRYRHPSVMNGAFPICHKGCALRIWLVVSAAKRETCGATTARTSVVLHRYLTHEGSRATFGTWYTEWLDDALRAIRP